MRNLIDILIFVFPVLFLYLLTRFILIKKIKINFKKDILRIAFVIYISSLIFVVWIRGGFYSDHLFYNFIPLKTIINYIISNPTPIVFENIVGNIIITMPLGFFAYFKIKKYSKMQMVLCSLLIPFVIELGQLLIYILRLGTRTVDIDDIILNSTGILLGYFFTRLFFRRSRK